MVWDASCKSTLKSCSMLKIFLLLCISASLPIFQILQNIFVPHRIWHPFTEPILRRVRDVREKILHFRHTYGTQIQSLLIFESALPEVGAQRGPLNF